MSARRLAGAGAWPAGLAVSAWVLHAAGGGPLAAPPLTSPGRWSAWLDARGPVAAGMSLLRLVALGGLWYVALVALVGAVLRLVGAASLIRVTDRVTIGPVRRMLAGTVSLGLAASGAVAVAAPAVRAPVAAQAAEAPAPSTSTTSTTVMTGTPAATVTMHLLAPAEPAVPRVVAPVPDVAPAPATNQWTVRPGECFWSVAERVLTDRAGRPPTDAEIVPYWRRLIEANRDQLVHRDNPDLILPGQTFTVPAP